MLIQVNNSRLLGRLGSDMLAVRSVEIVVTRDRSYVYPGGERKMKSTFN